MVTASDARRELVLRAIEIANRRTSDPIVPAKDWRAEHQLAGWLNDFARAPDLLHELLDDVPGGPDVIERLLDVVAPVDAGRELRPGAWEAYLVVRRPMPLDRDASERLIHSHYRCMLEVARELGDDTLEAAEDAPIEWRSAPSRDERPDDSFDGAIHDAIGDQFIRLASRLDHPLLGLAESAYYLAASYELARFVLWPAYREHFVTKDPYRPWATLWMHGISSRHSGSTIQAWSR